MATLINGNGNLAIYAQQDADWYAALMGGQTVITAVGNQFAYELLAANTIGVKDGVIITSEGRRIQLDANAIDSFDIPTGAQGTTNYYIIGYHLVTGDQSEQTCETFVQLMENGTDTIPEGSFRAGDDEVYVSLYRVEQNDLTIGTIAPLLPILQKSISESLTADDKLMFQFAKLGTNYGYLDADGNFVPFKNPIGTKSITANGTYDVTDYASVIVNIKAYNELIVWADTSNSANNGFNHYILNAATGAVVSQRRVYIGDVTQATDGYNMLFGKMFYNTYLQHGYSYILNTDVYANNNKKTSGSRIEAYYNYGMSYLIARA